MLAQMLANEHHRDIRDVLDVKKEACECHSPLHRGDGERGCEHSQEGRRSGCQEIPAGGVQEATQNEKDRRSAMAACSPVPD